ncbi:MAG: hypothetical protein FJX77_13260, partial [Armatimonadetes bacterium]|nr:hypothetical protein [Armatimonadota bacterium]
MGYAALHLDDLLGFQVVFSGWQDAGNPSLLGEDLHQQGERILDLRDQLAIPDVTPEQRGDVGFTARALARASGANLYVEQFYKPAGLTNRFLGRSRGIPQLRGTLRQLLAAIGSEWDYRVEKVG